VSQLPLSDALRAKLPISDEELLMMTGDELVERVGAQVTYEVAVELAKDGQAFAHYPGRPGRISDDPDLRERNLEILRLRIVERKGYAEIGAAVGLSRTRIPQLLRLYFGMGKGPRRPKQVTIPVEALAVVREALRMRLLQDLQDLCACITTGEPDMREEWKRLDLARALLRDVEADDDVEVYLGRKRGTTLIEALHDQLKTERHLEDTADLGQRGRAEAKAATIETLLAGMLCAV
jgi:hypothetical protein